MISRWLWLTVFAFLATSPIADAGRILFNGMHASSSHIGSMMPFAKRLSGDSHYVHFLESNTKFKSYNYPEDIGSTYIQLRGTSVGGMQPLMWTENTGPTDFPKVWQAGDSALVEMIREHNEELRPIRNSSWDLVIADELFAVSSHGLALEQHRKQGSAYIVLATCVSSNIMRWYMSLGSMFYYRPSMFHPVQYRYDIGSFISRFQSTFHASWNHFGIEHTTSQVAVKGLKLMGIDNFHLSQLAQGSSYYFVDDLNSLVWPYPVSTDYVHVGYTCPYARPLPLEYREFVEDPRSNGTILIAFGSNVDWRYVTPEIMDVFVEGINRLRDYRVFFAFNGEAEQVKDIGDHCIVTKWAPQKELLFHNRTKLFISHGGMKSIKDTICGEVPAVYMPLYGEQTHNAELARAAGIGEIFDKTKITADHFVQTVTKVLENANYKQSVIKKKKNMLDRPASSLDLVSFYSQRAIKYKEHFKSAAMRSSFFIAILALLAKDGNSGRILFNQMHDSGSHIGSMMPVAQRLVSDGHHAHFLESNTKSTHYKFPNNVNFTYIQLKADPILAGRLRPAMWRLNIGPAEFPVVWKTGDNALVEMMQEHTKEIETVTNGSFDLVVADEMFAISSYAMAIHHQRTHSSAFILLNTCVSTNIMRWHMALGSMFYWRPSIFHPVGQIFDMEVFYSRLHSTFHAIWNHFGVDRMTTYNAVRGFHLLGIDDFHLSLLATGSSYYYVDDLNSLVWPYPLANDLVHFGYTCPAVGQLPPEYRSFVEDPLSKGTIFIAFGSNVAWKDVTPNVIEAFVEGINRLHEYRIIFAFNGYGKHVSNIGSHCMITKWAPQKEILSHNSTILFISHGGMKSLKDTICGEVPVLLMPLFAEQTHNSEMARSAGIGEVISKLTVSAESFVASAETVIGNAKYKRSTNRMKQFMLDRPADSLELVSHTVRRAIKYRNQYKRPPTFRRRGMFVPAHEFLYLDALALILVMLVLLS